MRRRPIQGDTQFFSAEINLIPTKGSQVSQALTGKAFTGQRLCECIRGTRLGPVFFIMQKCNSSLFHFMSQCSQWKEHTHHGFGTAHRCISYRPHPAMDPIHLVNLFTERLVPALLPRSRRGARQGCVRGRMNAHSLQTLQHKPVLQEKMSPENAGKLLREGASPGMSQAPKQFKELFWLAMGTNCPEKPLTAFLPTDSLLSMPLSWQTPGCHRWSCRTQGF